jgi:cathepsin A (carboxypeptidase C)
MRLFYILLIHISWTTAIPLQSPLQSGAQLDWTNSECFPGGRADGNNTVCIQKVWDPVFAPEILGGPVGNQFCGYITITPGANPVQLFFWVVLSETNPAQDPVVLWMNGGPGISSLYGLFYQWGPRLIDNTKWPRVVFKENLDRMTEKLTWVFLEQPSRAGYSTGGPDIVETDTAAKDISTFLEALFHPDTKFKYKETELALTGRDLHIAGESYAGHWVPATGSYLVNTQKHKKLNLKSCIVGNAIVDRDLVSDATYKLLCTTPPLLTIDGSTPASTKARCSRMPQWISDCKAALKGCRDVKGSCPSQPNACRDSSGVGWAKQFTRNVYDVSKPESFDTAEDDFFYDHFEPFMNEAERKTRFGVAGSPPWQYVDTDIFDNFHKSGDEYRSFVPEVGNILEKGIDFMFYAVSMIRLTGPQFELIHLNRVIWISSALLRW